MMRTTITISDDLAARIENLRRKGGTSFKDTINVLLRDGLDCQGKAAKARTYRTKVQRLGLRAGIDPTKLNQLADELEIDAFEYQAAPRAK